MAQWYLKANGNVVPRRTVRSLTPDDLASETEIQKRVTFNELIKTRWGTSVSPPTDEPEPSKDEYDFEEYADDDEQPLSFPDFDDPVDATGRAIDSQPA
jgi:hypothetical protein